VFSFFLCGECFFDQNAHLRPIMGRFYVPMLYETKFNEKQRFIRCSVWRKSVFFARLKKWAACLWPTSGRRQILRLSLLKKQGLSSTPSRAKTVLIRVKNKFGEICEICGWEYFNQKYQIMRNEPNFSKSQMFITLIKTSNYNKKWTLDTWSKRTQTNPILSAVASAKEDFAPLQSLNFTHFNKRIFKLLKLDRLLGFCGFVNGQYHLHRLAGLSAGYAELLSAFQRIDKRFEI